jgi:hypothetical protein
VARAQLRDVLPRTHPALAAIPRDVDNVGTKLLIGDHHQLAAIGAGGGMDLSAQSGSRYELADARRFKPSGNVPPRCDCTP